ncbi:UDP-glycosyltransferase UGT5 [Daphnia magna]|uniref:UDP-glucuronosyltransferase n=1 Tax=Daphnia magna TaxID=35525 RepID=A0ABR0AKE4_9CRUS|nr:UDP-glycosyltransferase UGT5 [Daphnia magna]KAK4025591.1 hypothetical protein OUZ56_014652 [Daphnia magna]
MTFTFRLSLLLLVAAWNFEPASTANILFLSPITSYSHTHFFFYTIKALASRGHTITHWNGLKPREDIRNVTHLHSTGLQKVNSRHDIGFDTNNPLKLWFKHPERMANVCKTCYNDPVFHQLITSREQFDLIVIEAFMNECVLPLVQHFRAPFIYLSGLPPLPWMFESTCSPMSTQEYPVLVTDFTDEMNLFQRTINIVVSTAMIYFRNWFILPRVDVEARHAWINSSEPLPTVKEIENRLSLFITNSQPSLTYHYFKSSTIVDAGGLHLRPPKPLPKDVEAFVNGSADAGFIVLSFGSIVHGSGMPEATRKIFVAAFSRLPQRILWKWEDESGMDDLPANVRLYTWLPPLLDLLAHPKMRLLMTHGGLYSNQETVWSGVPLIGFPVFGDQSNYVSKAEKDGYAIKLDWMTLTEDTLYNSIHEIITNPKYKENVQKLSSLMREQIEMDRPLERAVHAIEHVARHHGAPHLRPASCRLNMLQRESMDVTLLLVLIILALAYLVVFIVRSSASRVLKWTKTDQMKKKTQ